MELTKRERISVPCILACVYLISMPLSIVPMPGGVSLLKLVSYALGPVFIAYLFSGKKNIRPNIVHLFLVLYLVYTSTSVLHFIDENSWQNIRGIFETSAIMILISTRIYNRREEDLMIKTWMAIGVITALMSLLGNVIISGERVSLLLLGGIEDPNQLCGYFILPILLYMKEITKRNKLMPFYIMLIMLICYIIFKTGSRGGLIAILIPIFAYVLVLVKDIKRIVKISAALIAVLIVFIYFIYPSIPEEVRQRYTVESVEEDRGSGRFEIWDAVYNSIVESEQSIIFGKGIGSTVKVLADAGIKLLVAHNHWLQIWCDQGLIGMFLFLAMLVICFFRVFKRHPEISVSLIGMAALSMSLTLYAGYKPFWNIILMASLNFRGDVDVEGERRLAGLQHGEATD